MIKIVRSTGIFVLSIFQLSLYSQTQVGSTIYGAADGDNFGSSVSMPDVNTVAVGAWSNSDEVYYGGQARVYNWNGTDWELKGTPVNGVNEGDWCGRSVSMPDANTIAVGFPQPGSEELTGHANVYDWDGVDWVLRGSPIEGEAAGDRFGQTVHMPDINTIAVSGPYNDGAGESAGHVRVYVWNGESWVQKGDDLDGESLGDFSGLEAVRMPDANTIAIGAHQNDDGGVLAGHVRVFQWNDTEWTQKGEDIDGITQSYLGYAVDMPDANTLAIGANAHDEVATDAGETTVYQWDGANWVQRGSDINGEGLYDNCGFSIAMPDENTLAVSYVNSSELIGYGGKVKLYYWDESMSDWVQKGSTLYGSETYDWFGWSIAMPDKNTIAIGAREGGSGTGFTEIFSFCDVESTVVAAEGILTCINEDVTYQWLDCDADYTPVIGAVEQDFVPVVNGNYAVVINQDGCIDTSECIAYGWVDLEGYSSNTAIKVYPNPGNGPVNIDFANSQKYVHVQIRLISGETVFSESFYNTGTIRIDLSEVAGTCVLELENEEGVFYKELLINAR